MLKLLVVFVFVALVLLIMRVSNLNGKIASMDQQLSDLATHEYVQELIDIRTKQTTATSMAAEIAALKARIQNSGN